MEFMHRLWVVLLVLTVFAGHPLSAQDKEKAATASASEWLALIDSHQYGESWLSLIHI